jgi:6-phosphogluconate dehydrogenase
MALVCGPCLESVRKTKRAAVAVDKMLQEISPEVIGPKDRKDAVYLLKWVRGRKDEKGVGVLEVAKALKLGHMVAW